MNEREQFEAVFSQPPFEFRLTRYGEDAPWPGHYVDYQEQLTWEGWQARAALAQPAAQSQSDTHPAVTYFPTTPVQGIAAFGPGTSVVQPAALAGTAPAPMPAPTPQADSVLEDADPLQGAANWLAQAHGQFCVAVLQGCLMIGYNRAKRLHDASIAARKQGGQS